MNRNDARIVSEQEQFTRQELHGMLVKALETMPETFWTKPSPNKSCDNGFYFNLVLPWVSYTEETKDEITTPIVAFRVLHRFGEMSPRFPFGLVSKKVISDTVIHSEKPSLVIKQKYIEQK